jgi:excisionase family DNA binding protein
MSLQGMKEPQRQEIMRIAEAATYLQCSASCLYRLAQQRKIPAFKLGASWRLKKSLLEEWMRR